jgi:hypothetical protein
MKHIILAAVAVGAFGLLATTPAVATQPGLFYDGAGRTACSAKPTGPCPTDEREIDAKSPRTCTHAGHVYEINIPASMPTTYMRCNPCAECTEFQSQRSGRN